jgi:hypothetical protein
LGTKSALLDVKTVAFRTFGVRRLPEITRIAIAAVRQSLDPAITISCFLAEPICRTRHRSATFRRSREDGEQEKQWRAPVDPKGRREPVTKGQLRMARFTFNLSQTVRYNVYVDAPTRMDALRKLVCDLQEPEGKPIDLYEVDNDGLTIDAGEMEISGAEIDSGLRTRRAGQREIQRGYDVGRRKEARRRV